MSAKDIMPAEGEGQYEDAEKYSADVVPVIPPFSVGREFGVTVAVCLAPYIHSYPDAGNNHEAAQSCEPDDGFSPKGGVLPQPGEVHPVGMAPSHAQKRSLLLENCKTSPFCEPR